VCSFHPVEPLIMKNMLSMVTISKIATQHKLLLNQEKLDIMHVVDAT
jgi:hypothetical protein